jgi:hypothetical protein
VRNLKEEGVGLFRALSSAASNSGAASPEGFHLTKNIIDPIYRFIMGTFTGKTGQTDPKFATEAVKEGIFGNIELTFDNFCKWIKSLFKEGGIFNKIGKGIGGIIASVYKWLSTMLGKIPGLESGIPGFTGITYGNAIACGLLSALVLIAFYKVFKGLLGGDNEEDKFDSYDRYSEDINRGNKLVVDFYNFTEHLIYNQKLGLLSEGIFGGIFEFVGRTIRKGFKFVGDIIKDVYKGIKKHPIFSFFVLILCFFVCFCMRNPTSIAVTQVAYGKTIELQKPGILDSLLANTKNAVSRVWNYRPTPRDIDRAKTSLGSLFNTSFLGFSEDVDLDVYVNTVFDKI